MEYTVSNINTYEGIIKEFTKENDDITLIICLEGDLGAGKTTFTQVLGKMLDSTTVVKSPTFTIHNEYDLKDSDSKLHHVDLYRLNSQKEVEELNIEGLCTSNHVIIIEWADKFKEYIKSLTSLGKVVWLKFYYVDENTRLVTLKT